jgi:ligand-binding SRPBCC domain-containing protein
MPTIDITRLVAAPMERCFDLARSIELHTHSTAATGEEAIAGVTRGLIGMGESVTWRARHFGVRQTLTSRITAFDRPRHFRDEQAQGAFAGFTHDHFFTPHTGGGTLVRDVFTFRAPLGILGRLAEALLLTRYMRRLLETRVAIVAAAAEGEGWRRYLEPAGTQ